MKCCVVLVVFNLFYFTLFHVKVMANCLICENMVSRNQLKVTCTECKGLCHASCVSMSKADIDYIASDGQFWHCPSCVKERRHSMAGMTTQAEKGNNELSTIVTMLQEAKEERRRMEIDLGSSLELCHNKIDDNRKMMEEQDKKFDNCLKLINDLTTENLALKKRVKSLEERVETSEQYSRVNMIEVYGIPEKPNEDVLETVKNLGKAVGMEITDGMVDTCHRLGKTQEGKPPPGIIISFVRRYDKQKLLQKKKEKKELKTDAMGYKVKNLIYINPSLSPERRRLLAAAKSKKSEEKWAYVWTTDEGKILVRKEEKGPVTWIRNMEDIDKL